MSAASYGGKGLRYMRHWLLAFRHLPVELVSRSDLMLLNTVFPCKMLAEVPFATNWVWIGINGLNNILIYLLADAKKPVQKHGSFWTAIGQLAWSGGWQIETAGLRIVDRVALHKGHVTIKEKSLNCLSLFQEDNCTRGFQQRRSPSLGMARMGIVDIFDLSPVVRLMRVSIVFLFLATLHPGSTAEFCASTNTGSSFQSGILRASWNNLNFQVFSLYQSVGACASTCSGYAFAILQGHVSAYVESCDWSSALLVFKLFSWSRCILVPLQWILSRVSVR
jgi:hypothetical protein